MDAESQTKPLVSIITPSYNQGQFLEETIQSVLNQDYSNIEYIVIDGLSVDNTKDIIKKYENRLTYWVSEPDKGQTDAIIKGFQMAKGKYITWLCSDDVLEPSMVSVSVAFLEANPQVSMTFGNRIRYDAKSNIIGFQQCAQFRSWYLRWGFAIPQETCMIRRQAYNNCGGLDISLHMAMDFDLFCKLSRVGEIHHIPAFLGRFRSHHTNKSTIFSSQVQSTGFSSGAPQELSLVYQKHFQEKFKAWKWKYFNILEFVLIMIYKRSQKYKDMRQTILKLQNQ